QRANYCGDEVSRDNSQETTSESNRERFREKLNQDVALTRTQGFLDADLARALGYGDQHDVHQSDSANAEREESDKRQQDLDAGRDDAELADVFHQVPDEYSLLVLRLVIVMRCQDLPNRFTYLLVRHPFVLDEDAAQVVRVFQIAH